MLLWENGDFVPLGQLTAEFRWGLLVIADELSETQVPDFIGDELSVASRTALVLRVMNGQDGEVVVNVLGIDEDVRPTMTPVGSSAMDVASGSLFVGDVERASSIAIPVSPGRYEVVLYCDDETEPEAVDVKLRPA